MQRTQATRPGRRRMQAALERIHAKRLAAKEAVLVQDEHGRWQVCGRVRCAVLRMAAVTRCDGVTRGSHPGCGRRAGRGPLLPLLPHASSAKQQLPMCQPR